MSLLASLVSRWFGARPPPIDPEAFTDRFADRLRLRLPAATIEILAPLSLSIVRDGEPGQIFLDNLFRLACAAADDLERADLVERYLTAMAQPDAGADAGADDIVPVLKPQAWLDALPRPDGARPRHRVEPLVAEVSIVYAVDAADTVSYVTEPWFTARGVPFEGLRRRAVDNLRGKIPKLDVQRGGGLNMVVAGGHYESSLLLFDEFWARELPRLRGAAAIAIPARDVLVFGDASDPRVLEELRRHARDIHADAAYPLSPTLLRRAADGALSAFED